MPALNSWQLVLVFNILSVLNASILAESNLEFFNFSMQIIDDILVLADMQGDQLFVSNGFCLDIFSSIGIFQCIDSLLKLCT